jgi:transcriptional regulator with XRE-family HTH domain
VANQDRFFGALGIRVKELRKRRSYSQEDMLSFGFSTRHWQQVEAGRPITVTTLLRICEVFELPMSKLVRGLDREGVYEAVDFEVLLRRKGKRKR